MQECDRRKAAHQKHMFKHHSGGESGHGHHHHDDKNEN